MSMVCNLPKANLIRFFKAVREFYTEEITPELNLLKDITAFLDELISNDSASYPGLEHKSILPAIRHLPKAVSLAGDKTKPVADAINQLAPFVSWKQTSGYEILGRHYLENYGYCSLIGPGLLIEHETLKLGFGIWGPQLHYPLHYHAAEECYHVIGHGIQFRRQGEPWQTFSDAQAIYNQSMVKHELKSTDHPMFVLYTWRGEVEKDAVLV